MTESSTVAPYDGGRRFISFNAKELVEDKNLEEQEHG